MGVNQGHILRDRQLGMVEGGEPGTDTKGQTAWNGRWSKPRTDNKGQTTRNGRRGEPRTDTKGQTARNGRWG